MNRRLRSGCWASLWWVAVPLLGCGRTGTAPPVVSHQPRTAAAVNRSNAPEPLDIDRALAEMQRAHFSVAEAALRRLASEGRGTEIRRRAELGLAWVLFKTGRRNEALKRAEASEADPLPLRRQADVLLARILRSLGELAAARARLEPWRGEGRAFEAQLLLGEIAEEEGKPAEARQLWLGIVNAYNVDRIRNDDAPDLALAARAAHHLGAWHDANELYNLAEIAGIRGVRTLLWRAELYLDAHDTDLAREVAAEALRYAPDDPAAAIVSAQVRLADAQDLGAAEQLARAALTVDPTYAEAHYVLSGIALRDMDIDQAEARIAQGLKARPGHLGLMALHAAARLLDNDTEGFRAAIDSVLSRCPTDARLFQIVADFAEAEHRYQQTIPLLRRAVALAPNDGRSHAQLGIELLRTGEQAEGRRELQAAFERDPFDRRVRNTLLLYDKLIDTQYTTFSTSRFEVQVPREFSKLLQRTVPAWLDGAYADMRDRYRGEPTLPVHVELYTDKESFGVRTSGTPGTFLQGVCFGRTVVSLLPVDEPSNLAMTLWHEMSHVFHLELSQYRVPRWFTEGLAEVETQLHRAEWTREQDLSVYQALRDKTLPHAWLMNRAFTHAESTEDLAVAYVASTYLVRHIVDSAGFAGVRRMLLAWASGKRTPAVIQQSLGISAEQLDRNFRDDLARRLERFDRQFIPVDKRGTLERARKSVAAAPGDPRARARLALFELSEQGPSAAASTLAQAPKGLEGAADLLWVRSTVALQQGRLEEAHALCRLLLASGNDGYAVRMRLALLARILSQPAEELDALNSAHGFDPSQAAPLERLAELAHQRGNQSRELELVTALSLIEENEPRVQRRHVELLLAAHRPKEALSASQAAVYADVLGVETHRLAAEAALGAGARGRALGELDLAVMGIGTTEERRRARSWRDALRAGRDPRQR